MGIIRKFETGLILLCIIRAHARHFLLITIESQLTESLDVGAIALKAVRDIWSSCASGYKNSRYFPDSVHFWFLYK